MNAISAVSGVGELVAPSSSETYRYQITDSWTGQTQTVEAPSPEQALEKFKRAQNFAKHAPDLGWLIGPLLGLLAIKVVGGMVPAPRS